jgi:hypothetical protein
MLTSQLLNPSQLIFIYLLKGSEKHLPPLGIVKIKWKDRMCSGYLDTWHVASDQ